MYGIVFELYAMRVLVNVFTVNIVLEYRKYGVSFSVTWDRNKYE